MPRERRSRRGRRAEVATGEGRVEDKTAGTSERGGMDAGAGRETGEEEAETEKEGHGRAIARGQAGEGIRQ